MNTQTGKKQFEKELKDSKYEIAVLNAYLKEDGSDEIAVLGQYYKKGAHTGKDKSLGLFSFIYDKEGKILHRNFISWKEDVAKFTEISKSGRLKKLGYIHFHEIIQTKDGKFFAVGETFDRDLSALGVLGLSESLTKITIKDMVMFEFSSDFKLEDVQFFDKTRSGVELGSGGDFTRLMYLARTLEAAGFFDYAFTQRSSDNSEFLVGYVDYEKRKGPKNNGLVFGAIAYADGEVSVDKISLKSGSRGRSIKGVFPAKPGYVMVMEYIRKEKRAYMDLEKINY